MGRFRVVKGRRTGCRRRDGATGGLSGSGGLNSGGNGLLGEVMEIDPDDPDYVSVHFQDGELLDDVHIDHLIPVTGVRILSPRLAA